MRLLTCVRHALWARRVANAEWNAHSLLSSFLQESLFPRLPPPLHTVLTGAFALSCSAIPQLSDSATRHSIRIFFLGGGGARATSLSINSPYFHTQKFLKRNSLLKLSGTREKKELEEILCHFQHFHALLSYKRTITSFSSVSGSFRSLSRVSYERIFISFLFFSPLPERG
jgi:hypothetical protein